MKRKAAEMDDDDERDAGVAEEEEPVEEGSDEDAPGEVDEEVVGSEADAAVAEDEDADEEENVGAVKTRATRSRPRRRRAQEEESEAEAEASDGSSDDESSKSGTEEDWEAADDDDDDDAGEGIDIATPNASRCIFCGQDEEHDPGEEFEEYLACSVCGDNAHRHCAREAASLVENEDATDWRCKDCVENGLEADLKNVPELLADRRRSSAPRMARDLLPSARGGIKPDAHSVFNKLILDEDPMDGSRSLRKRKTPGAEDDEPPRPAIRKRRRTNDPEDPEHYDGEPDANDDHEHAIVSSPVGAVEDEEPGSPKSRTGRPLRHLKQKRRGAWIVARREEPPKSVVVGIAVSASQWDQIEKHVQKKQRRRERDRQRRLRNSNRRTATAEPEDIISTNAHFPAVQTSIYTNPFYAFPDRETDEAKNKPYGGILTDAEAETARTYPLDADRLAFQAARDRAEQAWKEKQAALNAEPPARTKIPASQASKIKCINFGQFEIDTWHAAPYPEEYSRNKHLYICEFCLKYMSSDYVAWRHKLKCSAKHPPGDEIYRSKLPNKTEAEDGTVHTTKETMLSFWEVDGRKNPLYCQNLCLLAKLFLGSKTLYYDVEPFLFYIMTENDEFGCHFVGYFSKEKRGLGPPPPPEPRDGFDGHENGGGEHSQQTNGGAAADGSEKQEDYDPALSNPGNNVSCILVLPVHMRRGFGRVLIEFSYLLTKVEGRTGSPEKPLSDMGLVSYRSYWRTVLCALLLRYQDTPGAESKISIAQIAKETGMTPDDIISTLEALRFLVRDPVTRRYALRLDYEYMREYVEKHERKAKGFRLDPTLLVWTPYVMGKPTSLFAMGEEARGEVQTVAPRPEEEVAGALPDAPEEAIREVAAAQGGGEDSVETTEKVDGEDEPQTKCISPDSKKKPSSGGHSLTPQPFTTETKPEDSPDGKSSIRRSPRKTPNGTRFATRSASPSHHQPRQNGTTSASLHPDESNESNETPAAEEEDEEEEIPPTRFEIFPPIPGLVSAARRKPGRPPRGGSRRSITYSTPATANRNRRRRSTNTATRTRTSTDRSPGTALRRTRSKLGEAALVMNASDDDDDEEGEEEEEEEEKVAVREAADEDVAVEEEVDGDGVREVGGREEEEEEEDGDAFDGHDEDAEGSEEEEEIKYD
ncbi:hypothetical protein KC360_g1139 [Hortaea werneckii]|nr:hypothetical protein KC325_g1799 [Hortaea werneckii]KAI6998536.1 hypothetical protein KC359_g2281 [Hortaea werneckii]KAI7149289.1 hypothetical protein KC344_g1153 [Hortaea werneckii]KAI7178928.1 hypothetical protein KC360_g1139 [Hortaea werneckii]